LAKKNSIAANIPGLEPLDNRITSASFKRNPVPDEVKDTPSISVLLLNHSTIPT
jgi:hypothetical protein